MQRKLKLLEAKLAAAQTRWNELQPEIDRAQKTWEASFQKDDGKNWLFTKGLQAPVYFAGGVGLFLLATGSWRRALTWSHAAGIAVFLAVWGAWQVPFFARLGGPGVLHIYFGDVARNIHSRGVLAYVRHFVSYPSEVLCGCLMPWSVLLLLYFRRDFRRGLGSAREHVVFLSCSILAAFPTVWLAPDSKTRFFLVMYPLFAPLVGLVVERCCRAEHGAAWRRFWGGYLTAGSIVMAGAGIEALLEGAGSIFGENRIPHDGIPIFFRFHRLPAANDG